MSNILKYINIGLFVLQFTYYFSGIKILNKQNKFTEQSEVKKSPSENNSNTYNEEEHQYIMSMNVIVSVILSIILISFFNSNFIKNNSNIIKNNSKNSNICHFEKNENIYIFFNDFLSKSGLMRILFSFNLATLYLSNPSMVFWTPVIIISTILLSEVCDKTNKSIWQNFKDKFKIIFFLPDTIRDKIGYFTYVFIFSLFLLIILFNFLLENYYNNFLYWSNFILLLISLIFIIITIIYFRKNKLDICEFMIGLKNIKLNNVVYATSVEENPVSIPIVMGNIMNNSN